MKVYTYCRVSSKEQNLDRQLIEVRAFAERMNYEIAEEFSDKASGKDFVRAAYEKMKSLVVEGDIIIVKEMDRLGRNKEQIKDELEYFRKNGVRVILLDIPTTQMDLSTMEQGIARAMMEMINNLLIEVLSTIAEQERVKIKTRQSEGIKAAKERGDTVFGRPRQSGDQLEYAIELWAKKEMSVSKICSRTGVTKSTLYRRLRERGLVA